MAAADESAPIAEVSAWVAAVSAPASPARVVLTGVAVDAAGFWHDARWRLTRNNPASETAAAFDLAMRGPRARGLGHRLMASIGVDDNPTILAIVVIVFLFAGAGSAALLAVAARRKG